MDSVNSIAVITGASSGIGEAFARLLAGKGHDVVLVARRLARLEALATELNDRFGIVATPAPSDLTSPDAAEVLVEHLQGLGMVPDILINNAGYAVDGCFLDTAWHDHEAHFRVLASTPAHLIHLLLPGMLERQRGKIVNVASIGGLLPCAPFEGTYGPSKHFLVSLTRILAVEYKNRGVGFTVSCPGGTATELTQSGNAAIAFQSVPRIAVQSADAVARETWRAAEAGKVVVVPGWANKLAASIIRLTPERFAIRAMDKAFAAIRPSGGRSAVSRCHSLRCYRPPPGAGPR